MKVAIVGGGSYAWSFGFVRQFVLSKCPQEVTVSLMDTNPEALDLVARVCHRFNSARGEPVAIDATSDLEAALDGADFVIVSISTGGFSAMRHDLEIPQRYGIYHTVGDSVGPGGWLRAVRNIPVFHDIAERMSRLCPGAWMINVTNPLTPLTRVPHRDFGVRTIGMCPGVENGARSMAQLAGADPHAKLSYVVTGVDHGSWFTDIHAGGMDVLARLKELGYWRSDDELPSTPEADDPLAGPTGMRAGLAVWREIGYLPSIGDRHTCENWPWFLAGSPELSYGLKRTSIEERVGWKDGERVTLAQYAATGDEELLGGQGHGDDPVVAVIEALSGHEPLIFGANYANVGQIAGLPEGAVVETRCLFDGSGVHPFCSPMPDILKVLVLPHVLRQEMIIDIALTGSFDELVALVLSDPLCSRLKVTECRRMVREMLQANAPLIQNERLLDFN